MDPKLDHAAMIGDLEFLKKAETTCKESNNWDYLTSQTKYKENILHLVARNDGLDKFFQEAITILPDSLVHTLLCQPNVNTNPDPPHEWNPLHIAACFGNLGIVKLILGFYNSNLGFEPKPWLALDSLGQTPLHVALQYKVEDCALEIMSVDTEQQLCKMVDSDGNSTLFQAVRYGCNKVSLQILTSAPNACYSISGGNRETLFHYVHNSSEEVCGLLLEKHLQLIKQVSLDGDTVLHKWAEEDKLWPLEFILNRVDDSIVAPELKSELIDLIYVANVDGDNPFHAAADTRSVNAAKILAKVYRDERDKNITSKVDKYSQLPWLLSNKEGQSPLELIMGDSKRACDEFVRLKGYVNDMKSVVEGKTELLFLAVEKGLNQIAEKLWNIQDMYSFCAYHTREWNYLHDALEYSDEVALWVATRLPYLTTESNLVVKNLHMAIDINAPKFAEWMLKKYSPTLDFNSNIWIEACEKGRFPIIIAIVENCPNFRELCLGKKDSPLHHVKFKGYEQYRNLLKNSMMLEFKNLQNDNGETPLHIAIRNNNLHLAEALLKIDGVERHVPDKQHKTVMELLKEECKRNKRWAQMCKHNGILIPGLQTTFLQDKTNLLDVRNTLSVVAALLATITFTAGFTLPGGVKSDSTGKATLANKAAFLVFLLADTIALCCSMFVLICLIWSMIDHTKALLLIDQSMKVLLLALYSTLLAFMTGVYVVMPRKSLWASIVVIAALSLFSIISIKRSIMYKLLHLLNPKSYRNEDAYGEDNPLIEQGEESV